MTAVAGVSLRRLAIALGGLTVAGAAGFWWLTEPEIVTAASLPAHTPDLANGERMFWAGGCAGCHAAPKAEDDALLSLGGGRTITTGFGTFVVPNISPDRTDGIGGWSEAEFVTAMTKGVDPEGRHLYPAFPYTSYQRMTVEDLLDLDAYLATLPAVPGRQPDHALAFPYDLRRGLGLWKLLYLDGKPYTPDPAMSAEAQAGGYLVEGPGHCGECHTPRNALGGPIAGRHLAGGPSPEGRGRIPNITPAAIGDWSAADIADALESGFTPEGDDLAGSMAEVVVNMGHLAASDRDAMAAYLKAIPPIGD